MKFEEREQILNPKSLANGDGIERLSDGALHVSVTTRMPNVTAEMITWWFGDYMRTTEHYRRWHPRDHVWMDWEDKRPGTYIGAKHLVHEYIGGKMNKLKIHFLPPSEFFGESSAKSNQLLLCARVGFLDMPLEMTRLIHAVHNVPGGCEMRSHFWVGYVAGRGKKLPIEPIMNLSIVRHLAVSQNLGTGLATHCREEMSNLASFLPELYAREVG